MTTETAVRLSIADALGRLMKEGLPFRFEAFDGSAAGPVDAPFTLRLLNERGLSYLMTAPGDLGFARAYVAGDLELDGIHPGNPYDAMVLIMSQLRFKVPSAAEMVQIVRSLGFGNLKPPPPPAEEHLPKWRRALEGLRHNKKRDAEAIHHHYDVSNRFYELVLGPSMTYTCAVYPTLESTLEEAQFEKYDLIARKLDLKPGDRLLDIGCGWGGMVRHAAQHYGVTVLGVTLSREQATWAQEKIKEQGLDHLAEVRFCDYRDVKQYGDYFGFLQGKLKPGGRLLNHCITRPGNKVTSTGAFIDRYVFPDGELTGVGRITVAAQDAGLEVRHVENLREHYAMTLKGWCDNLVEHWDEALEEVTIGRAKVWGIYMAGSRLAFERNEIELHHVLAVKADEHGDASWPLRPTWLS